jgi:lipopolysaccharide export system protein LptC
MAFSAIWQAAPAEERARSRAFSRVRRHSRLVRVLRVVLPLAGIGAIAAFVVVARMGLPSGLDMESASLSVTRNSIIMEHPRLTGFDKRHREYLVTADRAIQPLTDPGKVRLENIHATLQAGNGGPAQVEAEAGDYDHGKRLLDLLGAITVHSSDGYVLNLDDAQVDFGAGTVNTKNPVRIVHGDSSVSGDSMSVKDNGKLIRIEGHVRTMLMPPKHEAKPAPTAGAGPGLKETE